MKAVQFEGTNRAYLVFEGHILLDGKTGLPALFTINDIHRCNKGYVNEVAQVVQSMRNPHTLRTVN